MKKTLAALAVLGAFGASAMAADVTLYGLVDLGVGYYHTDNGVENSHSFSVDTGTNSGSRFGLKGEEDLGNGLKVGFVLENGFNADNGTLGNDGRLFGRESSLYVSGAFGTLKFGRLTQLTSSTGTTGLWGGAVSPVSTGWGTNILVPGHKAVMAGTFTQLDNSIVYTTPSFAGFQVHVQYSGEMNTVTETDAVENKSSANRYYAIAGTYKNGPLNLVAIVDSYNYESITDPDVDDGLTVNFGGAYDFGVVKPFVAMQYFKDMKKLGVGVYGKVNGEAVDLGVMEGYGIQIGANIPVLGGTAKLVAGYLNAEDVDDSKNDLSRFTVGAAYEYPLSKRTFVYTGVGYVDDSYGAKDAKDANHYGATLGMVHKF